MLQPVSWGNNADTASVPTRLPGCDVKMWEVQYIKCGEGVNLKFQINKSLDYVASVHLDLRKEIHDLLSKTMNF